MKEYPILFTSDMVRANHEGRKRMTRRVVTPQPEFCFGCWYPSRGHKKALHYADQTDFCRRMPKEFSPYGQPGDRLWVREAWNVARCRLDYETGTEFSAFEWNYDLYGDPQQHLSAEASRENSVAMLFYAADGYHPSEFESFTTLLHGKKIKAEIPWRPSIHMPRWACRDVYTVTKVRIERLRAITEEDARAEGVEFVPNDFGGYFYRDYQAEENPFSLLDAKSSFMSLCDALYKKKTGRMWRDNPWVWVIEYDNPAVKA